MRTRSQRGFTLIVALLVLLVATLLVVGAIAFTGSERAAAAGTFSAEKLSACSEAARNMYLSRIQNVLFHQSVPQIAFDKTIPLATNEDVKVHTGHFDLVVNVNSAGIVNSGSNESNTQISDVNDESNVAGARFGSPGYYRLNATCKDLGTNTEQEVEFYVRLGGV